MAKAARQAEWVETVKKHTVCFTCALRSSMVARRSPGGATGGPSFLIPGGEYGLEVAQNYMPTSKVN